MTASPHRDQAKTGIDRRSQPVLLVQFPKSRGELVRISQARRGGFELRQWFRSKDGVLRPSAFHFEFGGTDLEPLISGLSELKAFLEGRS